MDASPLISLRHVGVGYLLSKRPWSGARFWALEDVSFDVYPGESLGIVGRNSAGKTTLLRVLAEIIRPDRGEILRQPDIDVALLSLQVGFLPQLTGRENAYMSGLLLGLEKAVLDERIDRIVSFAELEGFIDQPTYTYSAGMRARLGFSVAFQLDPDVLLVDEILSAGDREFRRKSAEEMRRKIQSEHTVVLVSHNASTIRDLCDRAIWLEAGRTLAAGDPEGVLSEYERFAPRRPGEALRVRSVSLGAPAAAEPAPGSSTASANGAATAPRSSGPSRRDPQYLFVLGCERSGTTALLSLLNSDERILLGRERFKFIAPSLEPRHFTPESFFSISEKETNYADPEFYGRLRKRWDSGSVRYIGDKNPRYYEHLEHLAEAFPEGRFIFLVRDLLRVASSYMVRSQNPEDAAWPAHKDYRRAVRDWNGSLSLLRRFQRSHPDRKLLILDYERFYSGKGAQLGELYRFLELTLTPTVRGRYEAVLQQAERLKGRKLMLSPEMVDFLETKRDRHLEVWALQNCLEA